MSKDYTTTAKEHAYMAMRQAQNRAICSTNKAENWFKTKLFTTGRKWTRQARWGFRIFDFWNHELGLAIEIDGPEHNYNEDLIRDQKEWVRSRILIFRVKNFNEAEAFHVIYFIKTCSTWNERREFAGMKRINT